MRFFTLFYTHPFHGWFAEGVVFSISPKCSFSCPSIIMHKAWKKNMSSDQNRNCLPYILPSFYVGSINMLFWWCQNPAIVGNVFFFGRKPDSPRLSKTSPCYTAPKDPMNEGSPAPEPIRIRTGSSC